MLLLQQEHPFSGDAQDVTGLYVEQPGVVHNHPAFLCESRKMWIYLVDAGYPSYTAMWMVGDEPGSDRGSARLPAGQSSFVLQRHDLPCHTSGCWSMVSRSIWKLHPALFCTLAESACNAPHVLSIEAPPSVALPAITSNVLGSYVLLENRFQMHRPVWQHECMEDTRLSLSAHGKWLVQQGPDRGTSRALLSLSDPTLRLPHLSSTAWEAWDGAKMAAESAITAAEPRVSWLEWLGCKRSRVSKVESEQEEEAGGAKKRKTADEDCEITGSRTAAEKNEEGKKNAQSVDGSDD